MAESKRGLEIHFAVSERVSNSFGNYCVSHMGFSIGDTGYNCGRNEGRNEEGVTSRGMFVMVRSPYRSDGFYLTMSKNRVIINLFEEFTRGYLSNEIDREGNRVSTANCSRTIPDSLLNKLWFTKTVRGFSNIEEIKQLFVVDEEEYFDSFQDDHPLLNNVSYRNYVRFVNAERDEECEILKKSYEFLCNMSSDQYNTLRDLSPTDRGALIEGVLAVKRDLTNRVYDTFLMCGDDFNDGVYSMLTGENCVYATFFFFNQGLRYVESRLQSPRDKAELTQMKKMLSNLTDGNEHLLMPWRSFRRARWHSDEYRGIYFENTPSDKVYWKDSRRKAVMTNASGTKQLRPLKRKKIIKEMLTKTDVLDYEREGIEYADISKLSDSVPQGVRDILSAFNIGSGGGIRTRFHPRG